jgi:hypothetical protein
MLRHVNEHAAVTIAQVQSRIDAQELETRQRALDSAQSTDAARHVLLNSEGLPDAVVNVFSEREIRGIRDQEMHARALDRQKDVGAFANVGRDVHANALNTQAVALANASKVQPQKQQ